MFNAIKRIFNQTFARTDIRKLIKNGSIVESFVCNGVQYYHWANTLGMATGRWIAVSAALERAQTGCTKEQISIFLTVMNAAASKNDTKTIKEQLAHMQVRMDWQFEPETAYELAATMFFDLNEDAAVPEHAYTQYKIKEFKKHLKPDFFLQVPFSNILTISASSTADFQLYTLKRLQDLHLLYQSTLTGPYSFSLTDSHRTYIESQVQQVNLLMQQYGVMFGSST